MAKSLGIDDVDGAVSTMGNEDSAACLVYIAVVKATRSRMRGKINLTEQLERHCAAALTETPSRAGCGNSVSTTHRAHISYEASPRI